MSSNVTALEETIAVLRAERRRAIDAYQFQKAKVLEKQIAQLRSDQSTIKTSSKRTGFSREFELEKETLRKSALELQASFQQELIAVRIQFQDRLEQLHKGQAAEMSDLAVEFSKALELESIRLVPESANLLRMSKINAGISKYELADQLHDEAVDVQTRTVGKRQADTHRLYESRQDAILQRHQNEVLEHEKRLSEALAFVHLQHRRELDVLRQKYATHVTKYRIPERESGVEELFAQYQLTDDFEHTAIAPKTPSPLGPSRAIRSQNFPGYGRKPSKT
jgi:hypothetical protein